jgi:hypothetical protein
VRVKQLLKYWQPGLSPSNLLHDERPVVRHAGLRIDVLSRGELHGTQAGDLSGDAKAGA